MALATGWRHDPCRKQAASRSSSGRNASICPSKSQHWQTVEANRRSPGGNMTLEGFFTTEELSAYLRIPVATIYQWKYRHTGPPAVKLGRHLRYRYRDVEAWLVNQA